MNTGLFVKLGLAEDDLKREYDLKLKIECEEQSVLVQGMINDPKIQSEDWRKESTKLANLTLKRLNGPMERTFMRILRPFLWLLLISIAVNTLGSYGHNIKDLIAAILTIG